VCRRSECGAVGASEFVVIRAPQGVRECASFARSDVHSARFAREKKVRASFSISAQKRTSCEVRQFGRRAAGAQDEEKGKKRRRAATKRKGDGTAKWAVLSLVLYLYNFSK